MNAAIPALAAVPRFGGCRSASFCNDHIKGDAFSHCSAPLTAKACLGLSVRQPNGAVVKLLGMKDSKGYASTAGDLFYTYGHRNPQGNSNDDEASPYRLSHGSVAVERRRIRRRRVVQDQELFRLPQDRQESPGPPFQAIAAMYVDDKGAEAKLAAKIREGGVGVWGHVPMPPQAQVTEAEALTLARWILELE